MIPLTIAAETESTILIHEKINEKAYSTILVDHQIKYTPSPLLLSSIPHSYHSTRRSVKKRNLRLIKGFVATRLVHLLWNCPRSVFILSSRLCLIVSAAPPSHSSQDLASDPYEFKNFCCIRGFL